MADILNLSFGCGNTLLASQLNQIVEAINRIYNIQSESNEDYIPISGSDDISGNLIPDGSDNYNLGTKNNYWKDIYTSTEHTKILKFHSQQLTYESLGELYVGKDTSNNNETILHFKHGNNNEEIVATRDWVNSLLNPTRINIGSTGSISEELYNDESNYIKIESSSDNPIVIAGYDENTLPSGIKFGDASTGDVLTVYNGKIYVNGDIFGGENGVSVLNDLSNVDASAPGTGDFLMYSGTGWVSSPLPESLIIHPSDVSRNEEYYLMYEETDEHPSGQYSWVERPPGANELNELDDVEIDYTKLELGQVLVYSQVTDEENNIYNSWVNKTVSGVLTYNQSDSNKYLKVKNDGTGTEWSDISLSDLSNTEIGGSNNALSNGLVLVYDLSSSKWKNTSLPANLPNTSTDNNGQYLTVENGIAKWVSVTPGSGLLWSDLTSDSANIINPSHLPVPNDNLGGIRATIRTDSISILSPLPTNNSKYYRVQVQNDGVAFVDVPWTASGLTSGSWANYFDVKTKGITPTSGYYLKWDSDGNLTQDSGSYTLSAANNNDLGGIRIGYTQNNKNYPVLLDTSNKAYVNVPWTDSGARTYTSVSGGPTSDQNLTFGGTFKVPYISLNTNGQLTVVEKTMTMPSSTESGVSSVSSVSNGGLSVSPTTGAVSIGINNGGVTKTMLNNNVGDVYIKYEAITDLISILNDSLNLDIITFANSTDHLLNVLKPVAYSGTFTLMYYYYFKGRVLYSSGDGYVDNPIFYIGSDGASFMCRKTNDSYEVAYVNNTTKKIEFKNVGSDTVMKDIISRLRGDTGSEFNYTYFPQAATSQNHVLNVSNVGTLYYFPNNS